MMLCWLIYSWAVIVIFDPEVFTFFQAILKYSTRMSSAHPDWSVFSMRFCHEADCNAETIPWSQTVEQSCVCGRKLDMNYIHWTGETKWVCVSVLRSPPAGCCVAVLQCCNVAMSQLNSVTILQRHSVTVLQCPSITVCSVIVSY